MGAAESRLLLQGFGQELQHDKVQACMWPMQLQCLPDPALELIISQLSLQEKLMLARLVLGSSSSTSSKLNSKAHAVESLLRCLMPQPWQQAQQHGSSTSTSSSTCGFAALSATEHARAAVLRSIRSMTCKLPERGSLAFLCDVPELQQLTLHFPDLSKQRRRTFDVSTLLQLSNLQQLSINADWGFFWRGPVTKPAMHKQLAATLPQLTTLKQLTLKYVFLPTDSRNGLAGLTQLHQLELLSLDHVVPYITPAAAGQLAAGLTALTSLSINQCFYSSDAHRIVEALQPLLPRLQALGLPRLQTLGQTKHVQDCVQLLRLGLQPSSLKALDLSRTRMFPDFTPALAQLTGLQELSVSQAQLEPYDVSVMASTLTQLTRLEAPDNHLLGDAGLQCLARLTQLRHVNISWKAQLGAEAMSALRQLPNLVTLIAHCKTFSDAAMEQLGRMTGLLHLDVSGSNAVALGDASLAALVRLTGLTSLHIQAPKDKGLLQGSLAAAGAAAFAAGLTQLTALQALRQLDLTRVEGIAPDAALFVTRLSNLEWLRLEGWCDRCRSSSGSGNGSSAATGDKDACCSGAAFQKATLAALPHLSHFVLWGGCKCAASLAG